MSQNVSGILIMTIVAAVVSAISVTITLKLLGMENTSGIAGGVAGGVSAAVVGSALAARKANRKAK